MQAELRKQAKRLRKVHLRNCLIDAQTKHQHIQVATIKQKCNREEGKHMWYLIKRTVRDPHSPSILWVQQVVEGEVKEYTAQEDKEQAIRRECKVRFFSCAQCSGYEDTPRGKALLPVRQDSCLIDHYGCI